MDRRNAIALGAAAALGGLPAARPDQQYFPAPGGQQIPGSRSGLIRAVRVIIGGTGPPSSGLFVYSPTIAAGNLVDSIAAASGTDGTFADAVIRGIVNYFPVGSPVFAVALQDGGVVFFSAATTAGPWSNNGSIGSDSSQNIRVNPAGTGNTIFASGITTGVPVTISGPESGGVPVVDITDTASPSAPIVRITANAINDILLGLRVTGDTNARIILDTTAGGLARLRTGPGNAAPDTFLIRVSAALWAANFIAFNNAGAAETWNAPAFANSWANNAGGVPLGYKRVAAPDNCVAWVGDMIAPAGLVSGQAVITAIPAAYRPTTAQTLLATDLASNLLVRFSVTTAGVLQYQSGGVAGHSITIPTSLMELDR
jgi:hypothetical protein